MSIAKPDICVRTFHTVRSLFKALRSTRCENLFTALANRERGRELARYISHHHASSEWRTWSFFERTLYVQFAPLFEGYAINTIAYVGAHNGEKALALDKVFPGRVFYLFEPAPDTFKTLVERTADLGNLHCSNYAAGDRSQALEMFMDDFSQANSLLAYEPLALEEFPYLGKQKKTTVKVETLDALLRQQGVTRVDLVIIDTQGYEDKVLAGAGAILATCSVVVCEMNLKPLYAGSATFDSVYQKLNASGLTIAHILETIRGESQQILQLDCAFVRSHAGAAVKP